MQLRSSWNNPFVAIEESRKESQFRKFALLGDLWNSPFEEALVGNEADLWIRIFAHQQESLQKAMKTAPALNTFFNSLQSACWQYGKLLAEKDWPQPAIEHPHEAYLALCTLKVGQLKNADCFLLERKTKNLCTFYWMGSPIEFTELCMLYHEVFRGYFYHLSRNLRTEVHSSILPGSAEKTKAWKINLLWID